MRAHSDRGLAGAAKGCLSRLAYTAKFTDDPSWKTYTVASGHDIMVDAPDRLTEILEEVAR